MIIRPLYFLNARNVFSSEPRLPIFNAQHHVHPCTVLCACSQKQRFLIITEFNTLLMFPALMISHMKSETNRFCKMLDRFPVHR